MTPVRTGMVFGLALALGGAAAGAAGAQGVAGTADAKPLVLLCSGTDSVPVASAAYGYSTSTVYSLQRVPAQLGVMVEKGEVRVRPPESSQPLLSKAEADGWYRLKDPQVTEFLIRGRTPRGGALLNDRLDLDRRTGAATFAGFVGVCRSVPNPAAPAF